MVFDYFLVSIAVFYLAAASISDIRTREVPDWMSYSLITIALSARTIYSLSIQNYAYIISGLLGFGIFFLVACIMYYTKQWGGGDSKLLMGLGALFGTWPISASQNVHWPFQIPFPHLLTILINILLAGAVYGLIAIAYFTIKDWQNFKERMKKTFPKSLAPVLLSLLFLAVLSIFVFHPPYLYITVGGLASVILLSSLFFVAKAVEDVSMHKRVLVSKLTEGDWPAADIKLNGKIICRADSLGLETKHINELKKAKVKYITIKEGLPFIPSFLIGFLISLLFGNLFNLLV